MALIQVSEILSFTQSGLRVYHGIPNFQTNSDVQESFGRMSFVLWCFVSTSDVATKRSGDARKMLFFFRSNWRPKSIAVVQHCSAQNGIAYAATIAVLVLPHTTRPLQVTSRFLAARRMRTIAQLKQGWNLAELHRSPRGSPMVNWAIRFLMVLEALPVLRTDMNESEDEEEGEEVGHRHPAWVAHVLCGMWVQRLGGIHQDWHVWMGKWWSAI